MTLGGPRNTLRAIRRRLAQQRWTRVARALPRRASASAPTLATSPLRPYESLLPVRGERTVVVIAHRALREQVTPWLMQFSGDHCHVVSAEAAPEWRLDSSRAVHHVAET